MATDISSLPFCRIPVPAPDVPSVRGCVEIDTSEFERSHLRSPRGRGGWLFLFPTTRIGGAAWVGSAQGTYTEACKIAARYARLIGAFRIVVLP